MHDSGASIRDFVEAAAARRPTPGGGSIAALAGALAAAAGEMAVNYSIGKKGLEAHAEPLGKALAELTRARQMLLELMAEDQTAYEAMTALRKQPANDAARQAASRACIRVPQSMAATAMAVLRLCDGLTGIVNVDLLSDLAVCAELSMATVRCGIYNVRVNLTELGAADRQEIGRQSADMEKRAVALICGIMMRIKERTG